MVRSVLASLAVLVASLAVTAQAGSAPKPLDVAGDYNGVTRQRCRCWGQDRPCDCARPDCEYVEQLSATQPDQNGKFQLTIHAAESGCYSGQVGPFDMDVDRCGTLIAGVNWAHNDTRAFDPNALDQELDLMVAGNVLGFGGAPAALEHTVIMRENITICGTQEFLEGRCTPGEERLICVKKFAYCAKGDCATKNKKKLSPLADSFAPPVTSTGLNGTYMLSSPDSSANCPSNISVFQFGTELGLGWSQEDMRMARLSAWLPDKDAAHECVSFFSHCNGVQWSFDRAHMGSFARGKDNKYVMTMFDVLPVPENSRISLSKCVFRAATVTTPLIDIYASEHTTVVVLGIFLALAVLLAGGLLVCCLKYRRDYVDTKISRHYDIFQGIGNPGI